MRVLADPAVVGVDAGDEMGGGLGGEKGRGGGEAGARGGFDVGVGGGFKVGGDGVIEADVDGVAGEGVLVEDLVDLAALDHGIEGLADAGPLVGEVGRILAEADDVAEGTELGGLVEEKVFVNLVVALDGCSEAGESGAYDDDADA